jgi:hypothetical protein
LVFEQAGDPVWRSGTKYSQTRVTGSTVVGHHAVCRKDLAPAPEKSDQSSLAPRRDSAGVRLATAAASLPRDHHEDRPEGQHDDTGPSGDQPPSTNAPVSLSPTALASLLIHGRSFPAQRARI